MGNIVYIIKRLKTMDRKAMKEKINSIHKKTKKSKFSIFMDMQKCARKYGAGYMDYDLYEMYNLTDEQRNTYLTIGFSINVSCFLKNSIISCFSVLLTFIQSLFK